MIKELTFFFFFVFLPSLINAQQDPVFWVLCNFIVWVRNLLLIIAILSILFAGYKILTSSGEPGRLEEAKKMLLIIVLAMGLLAGIVFFLQQIGLPNLCA
ncbi:MAG: hypothetical protein ACPLZH_00135 [Minisyncoccales bacterium]